MQPREIHSSCQQGTVNSPFACAESYPQTRYRWFKHCDQTVGLVRMNLPCCCWTALAVTVACWTESVSVMSRPFTYVVWCSGTVEPTYGF
jgi:hypothetical protein